MSPSVALLIYLERLPTVNRKVCKNQERCVRKQNKTEQQNQAVPTSLFREFHKVCIATDSKTNPGESASKTTPVPRCNAFHGQEEFYLVEDYSIRSHLL